MMLILEHPLNDLKRERDHVQMLLKEDGNAFYLRSVLDTLTWLIDGGNRPAKIWLESDEAH